MKPEELDRINRAEEIQRYTENRCEALEEENAELEAENNLVKSLLYCTKGTCDNCGFVNCENFQRQRKSEPCTLYVSYKDRIKNLEHENDVLIESYNNSREKLTKAKDIIRNLLRVTYGEGWNYSLDLKVQAEKFLKEE